MILILIAYSFMQISFFLSKISANCNIKYNYDKKKAYNAVWLISIFVF